MNNYNNIALHYYQEVAPMLQGKVAEAFKDQRKDLLSHIAATIEKDGPQAAASQLNALASFSQSYDGRNNPFLGDALNAMHDMITAGINPGTTEWRSHIQNMGDQHLLRTTAINKDGTAKVYENAGQNVAEQAVHPLAEALAAQKENLKFAMQGGDEDEINRIQHVIDLVQRDIQRLNPSVVPKSSAPDKPQKSPEAMARQVAEDARLQESFDRYDAQDNGRQDTEETDFWDQDDAA